MDTKVITVRTGSRPVVYDLTAEARSFLGQLPPPPGAVDRPVDGLLQVFVPHATAGVAILETGAGSDDDLLAALDEFLPTHDRWRHRHGSPGHGRDHVLPAFVAPYATVPVVAGELCLGTWQSICLVDTNGDNPTRQVRFSLLRG